MREWNAVASSMTSPHGFARQIKDIPGWNVLRTLALYVELAAAFTLLSRLSSLSR